MREPVVEVMAEGEAAWERTVEPEGLRIGRLRENEVVLGGRSVSRRHASLRRDGARVVFEDGGSENGSYVNGARVERPVALQPGDELRIGPHRIVLREGFRRGPAAAAPAGAGAASDPSDLRAAEEAATLAPRGGEPVEASTSPEPEAAARANGHDAAPEAGGEGALFGDALDAPDAAEGEGDEAELWLDAPAEGAGLAVNAEDFDVRPEEAGGSGLGAEPEADPEADLPALGGSFEGADGPAPAGGEAPARGPERKPDAGAEPEPALGASAAAEPPPVPGSEPPPVPGSGAVPEAGSAEEAATAPEGDASAPAPGPDGLYAGFVVQREGRLDGVVSWEGERLVAGRGTECEIVLDRAEVSRRHARFVREEGAYVVYDAGSANGTRVNGERVERRALEIGDVVEIDTFALTFLLDAQPIESVVRTASLPSASAQEEVEETRFADADALDSLGGDEAESPSDEASVQAVPDEESVDPTPGGGEAAEPCAGLADAMAAEEGAAFAPEPSGEAGAVAAPAEPESPMPELGEPPLAAEEEDEEKDLEALAGEAADALPELGDALAPAMEQAAPLRREAAPSGAGPLRLELALDVEALPEPLREALRALGDGRLRVPVELRVRQDPGAEAEEVGE